MPTLAELTLTLSQDITRNEHERTAAVAALDDDRSRALAVLPGAEVPMRRQAEAAAKARAEHDETLLDIEADLREGERQTTARRRADEEDAEQRVGEGDQAAEQTRRLAEDKARMAFEAAVLAVDRKDLSPGEKVLARAEARRAMDRSIAAAQDAFADARLANQDRWLDERRAALDRELADAREHRAKAAARRLAAGARLRSRQQDECGRARRGLGRDPGQRPRAGIIRRTTAGHRSPIRRPRSGPARDLPPGARGAGRRGQPVPSAAVIPCRIASSRRAKAGGRATGSPSNSTNGACRRRAHASAAPRRARSVDAIAAAGTIGT